MESKHKTTTIQPRQTAVFLTAVAAVLLLFGTAKLFAQSNVRLFVSQPDLSHFPIVSFTVRTADDSSVPLPDIEGISVRENGLPIGDVSMQTVPVGIDVAFVLDTNEDAGQTDGSGTPFFEPMSASVARFATRFMNTNALDTVTVVVADGNSADLLLNAATTADQIVAALDNYTPQFTPTTPLDAMLTRALDQLIPLQTDNRFQAILLLSDAGRLDEQLADSEVVSRAQANNIAIFVAITGAGVSVDEIDNATLLVEPSNGFYVPLSSVDDADPIFLIWQRQSNHVALRYESRLRDNGTYPLTVNLGQANAAAELTLAFAPPEVELLLADETIRRAGTAVDTPLENLMPAVEPLTVAVSWPDGLPRQLARVSLLQDAQPVLRLTDPAVVDGTVILEWAIADLAAGAYELAIEVEDSLGKTAVTEPQLVTILTQRPPEPTPTIGPTPSPTPPPSFTKTLTNRVHPSGWIGGALTLLLGALLLPFVLRRQRSRPISTYPSHPMPTPVVPPDPYPALPDERQSAMLRPQSHGAPKFVLRDDAATVGRAGGGADWQIGDHSLSLLHARIRWQNGRFWLYDEGSSTGTYLNTERLGLRPLPINDGDQLRFGRLLYRFELLDEEE